MIAAADYRRRRRRLMSLMDEGSIAVLPAAGQRFRNRNTEYPFRQDSDFYYLTGFAEPDAVLVLAPGRAHGQVVLFCREREARAERYDGERVGPERAVERIGVDDAFPIDDLEEILPGMLEGRERIYITLGEYPEFDNRLMHWVAGIRAREAGGAIPPGEFVALKHLLHEQRLYKSAAELRVMREAARITCSAHRRAMAACLPGMSETQLEAELLHEFMVNGARSPAYPSIVGGGANACVLHYVDNLDVLRRGDLVLIDAGCEYQHYASDVTRTFPVAGKFSAAQRALYEVVLEANRRGIEACRPGATFIEPHRSALKVMVEGLVDLKLMEGGVEEIVESERYREFCPHNSSHWLGSDVHDVGDYRVDGAWRPLEPGMVLTVEPGIYIPADESTGHLAPRWRGVGIRVEDDVAITREGHEVLSAEAPKSVDEIEAVMRGGNDG
ncbi:MAG: Xaa-Pro aminopeptidase [Pseudomonadales bacterium]|nr:Xaa-Pro aminopeptidase [Pseudomonadales bacterium]NIX07048.1 Xaa-Pro aminopeptidase [Pseudomonadales bacterium]